MKVTNLKNSQAFALIELLVVITIIAILASFATPAFQKIQEKAKRGKDVNNQRQIVLGCRTFAADWDGSFPFGAADDDAAEGGEEEDGASSSVDCFNDLVPDYIDTEAIFWIKTKNPDKQRAPKEDGELEGEECTFVYVNGQFDTSFSRSPLVADGEMDGPGEMGEYHPWLDSKKCVVGFVGGHVKEMPLNGSSTGSTVMSDDRRVENIFEERPDGEESEGGGLLDTDQSNVLLPE